MHGVNGVVGDKRNGLHWLEADVDSWIVRNLLEEESGVVLNKVVTNFTTKLAASYWII